MTTSEITNIVLTVAIVQLVCDFIARKFVFEHENYERALGVLSRAAFNLRKIEEKLGGASASAVAVSVPTDKQRKKYEQAKARHAEAAADVAKRHQTPSFWTSLVFVLLYRILSTEYYGKIVAVLPFIPFRFFQRMTLRGIEFDHEAMQLQLPTTGKGVTDPQQACSFLLIYVLSTLSVKYFISQATAVKPPSGAEGGFWTMLEDPKTKKLMEKWGLDTELLNDEQQQQQQNTPAATSSLKKRK